MIHVAALLVSQKTGTLGIGSRLAWSSGYHKKHVRVGLVVARQWNPSKTWSYYSIAWWASDVCDA